MLVGDGSAAGVEALVRWRHPTRGLVLPDEFIPLAEQSGLMQRLTDYVLETALAQAAEWCRDGLPMPVAVNVSMRDLHDAEFARRLGEGLRRHGVPADLLCLEITERVLMADRAGGRHAGRAGRARRADQPGRLRHRLLVAGPAQAAAGARDQGRPLVRQAARVRRRREDDATIVRSIIDLAHSLGLTVVAEGVESEATMERLRAFGCDRAQGWHLSPALPAADVTSWLQRIRSSSAAPRLRLAGT